MNDPNFREADIEKFNELDIKILEHIVANLNEKGRLGPNVKNRWLLTEIKSHFDSFNNIKSTDSEEIIKLLSNFDYLSLESLSIPDLARIIAKGKVRHLYLESLPSVEIADILANSDIKEITVSSPSPEVTHTLSHGRLKNLQIRNNDGKEIYAEELADGNLRSLGIGTVGSPETISTLINSSIKGLIIWKVIGVDTAHAIPSRTESKKYIMVTRAEPKEANDILQEKRRMKILYIPENWNDPTGTVPDKTRDRLQELRKKRNESDEEISDEKNAIYEKYFQKEGESDENE